jgi:2-dehydropantoate 2-reductase
VIAVLGSGAVGALIAAELHAAGTPVMLVTTEASAEAIEREGVTVVSPAFGEHVAQVPAVTELPVTVDVLLVAVKAPHLEAAIARIDFEPRVVVPLLNGVDHMAVLRKRFAHVVAGTVRVQAHREGRTKVVHRAPFLTVTTVGEVDGLEDAPFEVVVKDDEPLVLWGKLSRLAGLALATSAADAPLGEVRDVAETVAREVAEVARAEGAPIDAETIVAELRGLPDAATSSLRADLQAGARDHELDAIGGAVLRAADRHGLRTPVTAALVGRIGTL